jgi:hypothetical protein
MAPEKALNYQALNNCDFSRLVPAETANKIDRLDEGNRIVTP